MPVQVRFFVVAGHFRNEQNSLRRYLYNSLAVYCGLRQLPVQTGNITVNGVDIPFTEVKNYFVNNTVTEMPPTKITSEAVFLKNFGMAAVMGEGGQPTGNRVCCSIRRLST